MKKTGRRSSNIIDKRHDIVVNIPKGTARKTKKEKQNRDNIDRAVSRTTINYVRKGASNNTERLQAIKSQDGPRDLGILTKKREKEKLKKMSKTYMDFVNKK